MLRIWGWGWVLLALFVVGCAGEAGSSASESATGGNWGGQTGSLAPDCGTGKGFDTGATLPSGDAAFVYYDDTCMTDATDFGLSDQNGDPIDFHLEQLSGGGVLVKADEALLPGVYTVSTPEGSEGLVVTEAAPIPTSLGSLTDASTQCSPSLLLTFSKEVAPYLPLVSLSYSIDGGPSVPWFDYGTLDASDELVRLYPAGLELGPHEIEIQAKIAGESDAPDSLSVEFEVSCEGGGGGGCAIAAARPLGASGAVASSWLALLVLGWWRRRSHAL